MSFIPVSKLDDTGAVTDHPFKYYPCLKLRYSFQWPTTGADGRLNINGLHHAWALIDTGADYNLVRASRIPPTAELVETVTSFGVNGKSLERIYHIAFFLQEADHIHTSGAISWSPSNDPPYDLILGRKFLQMCTFTYDRHNGIAGLQYAANPHAI